jgi:uncharacterized integral membrane protein (TIGR00698 family)
MKDSAQHCTVPAAAHRTAAATSHRTIPGWPNSKVLFTFAPLSAALMLWGTPPVALLAGLLFALALGNPFPTHGAHFSKSLLQVSVVLLGFGMNLGTVLQAGINGSVFAAFTIGTTLILGYWLGRRLDVPRNTSALISAGTAICGGSAIAAVGSVMTAVTEGEIAVAMGTVFILNAIALYLFPAVGHLLHLSPHQFGVWAGVAVHDISSVVGAASVYGQEALETATAVKLSRTLWIVPLTLTLAFILGQKARHPATAAANEGVRHRKPKLQVPWFIAFFLLASVARSYVPALAAWSPRIAVVARAGMTLVLCLIGASLSPRTLRMVGWKAAAQGAALWLFISLISLGMILWGNFGD